MARKVKVVNWALAEHLIRIHCTDIEICAALNVDDEKLLAKLVKRDHKMTLGQYLTKHRSAGNISIRRAQYKLGVEELDGPMLRWLGKNLLGQEEQIRVSGFVPTGPGSASSLGGPLIQIVIQGADPSQSATEIANRWYDYEPPGQANSADSAKQVECDQVTSPQDIETSAKHVDGTLVQD